MFFAPIRRLRWPLFLLSVAALPSLTGCGGGGGGPQVTPTATPTTAPIASGRIAWMSDRDGTFHIYVMNGDGTAQVRLTKNAGLERSPAWSPDGTRLAFSYSADGAAGNSEIYTIKSDGTGLTRLTNNSVEDDSPSFSRDGQYIAWARSQGNVSSFVFVAKSDGSGARQVSRSDEFARTPSFDPQGRIVYSAKNALVVGAAPLYQIVRANRDGSNRVQLSATTSNLYFPSVSPDGSTLVYVDDASTDFQLYTTPVSSFQPQQLAFALAGDSDPSWTPDGRLLFSSILRDQNSEIYVANLDGSALKRLTTSSRTDRLPVATGPFAR